MTIAIVYTGGAYGTYLEWCLITLTSDIEIRPPFTSKGNSHHFPGHVLKDIEGWKNFVATGSQLPFVRFHPKTRKEHSLSSNLDYVCNTAQSVVYLYPDTALLTVNNWMTKTCKDWWANQLTKQIDYNLIYQNWSVDPATPFDQVPYWIQREFLSFYLMPAWYDQVEWNHLETWSHPNCCVVTVGQLLHDFENSIHRIKTHCNLQFKKDVAELVPFHQQNLKLQKYITQDQICNQIIDAIVNNQLFEWEPLPLGSEAWVQWQLRNLGYEIMCNELDIFPTNSVQLRKLLYQP